MTFESERKAVERITVLEKLVAQKDIEIDALRSDNARQATEIAQAAAQLARLIQERDFEVG